MMIPFSSFYRRPALLVISLALGVSSSAVFAAVGDPAGSEFQVNTYTLADQKNPAVAINAGGGFVVVWESVVQAPGDFSGIYAQRYDAAGAAQGSEFQVNTVIGEDDQLPRVAMNDAGAFVVVWESIDQDGNLHVYSRRFDAAGAALGSDQEVTSAPVSTYTISTKPAVAMDASGNYVVAWENFDDINADEDIYARRFAADGVASSTDFRVNSTIANDQAAVALAMNTAGDFVISWQSAAQDGDGNGIYAQLYDAAGAVLKSEFPVNTTTLNEQITPAVAMSADGFVVTWQSLAQDGDGNGIYAQRYDAIGTALGGEFPVNTTTASEQTTPAVAKNADGFTVAWESLGQDGDLKGIYAQRFDMNGVTLGGEFQVNTTTVKDQALPAVAMNSDSASIVAWQSYAQDKSWNGIYAQRYLGNTVVTSTSAADASGSGGGGAFGLFGTLLILPVFFRLRQPGKSPNRNKVLALLP
jgi:hypothetical protein